MDIEDLRQAALDATEREVEAMRAYRAAQDDHERARAAVGSSWHRWAMAHRSAVEARRAWLEARDE